MFHNNRLTTGRVFPETIAGILLIDSPALLFAFAGTLAVVFLALDWWSWKALSWDPVDGELPASKAPPNERS